MLKKILYLSALCLFAIGTHAEASTIGPSCPSCFGSTYTLTYTATGTPNVFDINLAVDTTGYTGASTNLLNAASLKIVSQNSQISSISLLTPPSGFSGTIDGGVNASGCSGAGSGYFCSQSSGNGLQVGQAGDIYNFDWQVTVANPSDFLTGADLASVKVLYVNSQGSQAGITSENITLDPGTSVVPEPSSFVLLGTGLLGAAGLVRRKLFA
jgi:hypothetical protein